VASNAGGATTNRVRSTLEAFLGWAIRQGHSLPQGNVASLAERRAEMPRDRMLNDAEIATVWNACRDDDYGAIIRLLILTGQREGEIGSLRWDEVKDDRIELPGSRTKNGRAHVIPLSAPAKTIIDKFRMAGRTFVFGRDDRNGFKGWGPAKTKLLERIAQAGTAMTPWVVHDLRRSAASGMQRLGIRVEVIERVLNHVSGVFRGVAGVYQRDPMSADVRDALDRWARHIVGVVEDKSIIVPMRRGA
jgi:integrase